MSDPETTIRVESCRGDGRCPECGGSVTFTRAVLPCGCRWHQDCSTITAGNGVAFLGHTLDLLTEALRQRDAALGEAAHWKTSDEAWVAVAGRAMAILGNHHSSDLVGVAERAAEERDAAIRSLEQTRAAMEAGDLCTVCAGTGKPVSGKPCICGGHGGIGNQIIGLTREAFAERERAKKAEALLRECERFIAEHSTTWRSGRRLRDAMLARIREALSK